MYNFNKQDQDILLKIYKFKKFVGNEIKHEREFSLNSNFTKLIWCKNLEGHRDRGNLHTLLISDIIDIFNGVEKSEVLKKYIKTYPNEIKDKNCFITKGEFFNDRIIMVQSFKKFSIENKRRKYGKKFRNIK